MIGDEKRVSMITASNLASSRHIHETVYALGIKRGLKCMHICVMDSLWALSVCVTSSTIVLEDNQPLVHNKMFKE
jgi:hypothetical protein